MTFYTNTSGQQISSSLSALVELARQTAFESKLALHHGAVLFRQSGKHILETKCNSEGNRICGYDVPSCHAEANCLTFFSRQEHRRQCWKGLLWN
jgi:hypothetical protein